MAEQQRPDVGTIATYAKRAPTEGGRGFVLTLPVKEGWPQPLFPISRAPGSGVDPNGRETREGEQAMAVRTLVEDQAAYSVRRLLQVALQRFGTKERVAEELVAMEPSTAANADEIYRQGLSRDVYNMLRKVQEHLQTHDKHGKPLESPKYDRMQWRNRRRMARLIVLFVANLSLGVGGWWRIHEKTAEHEYRDLYMRWDTPGRETPGRDKQQGGHVRATAAQKNSYMRAATQVILNDGEGFTDLVLLSLQDQFKPYPVELLSVHALFVEMSW